MLLQEFEHAGNFIESRQALNQRAGAKGDARESQTGRL